jgi:hypothetical protein
MAKGNKVPCRDCARCTESPVKRAVMGPARMLASPVTGTRNLLRKKCRRCGHPLAWHKVVDGRFAD